MPAGGGGWAGKAAGGLGLLQHWFHRWAREAAAADGPTPPLPPSRHADVAASIAQCGGVHALVQQLTAGAPERRMAGCSSLYFLGWQGASIRWALGALGSPGQLLLLLRNASVL